MALKKQERQALILDILSREVIDSQEGLMNSLQAAGIEVTQATVSRDIKEMRIIRRADGSGRPRYQVMSDAPVVDSEQVQKGFAETAVSVTRVEFMTVVKTTQGNGNRLAALIDAANLSEVIATLAGHNTIYVTSPSAEDAEKLAQRFTNWMQ
ncbi:arginine repressor [Weissella confusa]